MTDNTPLGDRMKRYEMTYRQTMPRRTYTLMRLDGRAFHTYLKDSEKPFDRRFTADMDVVATALCIEIQGAQFAYTQSDEISLLLTDFQFLQSELWFGGRVDKMTSVAASIASVCLDRFQKRTLPPQFDCRIWSMSDPVEVANYFLWRQRDAVRNSIQMLAQHYFTQAQLHGKKTDEIQEMLFSEHGINWNDLDAGLKRGRVISPKYGSIKAWDAAGDDHQRGVRPTWQRADAPHFAAQPDNWLAAIIPPLPNLWR